MNTSSPIITLGAGTLFSPVNDRKKTQLAYEAMYAPWSDVTNKDLVAWRKMFYLPKAVFLSYTNEERTAFDLGFYLDKTEQLFPIVWANNNIPTEQEWNRKSDRFLLKLDLRISPAIDNALGRVCILEM